MKVQRGRLRELFPFLWASLGSFLRSGNVLCLLRVIDVEAHAVLFGDCKHNNLIPHWPTHRAADCQLTGQRFETQDVHHVSALMSTVIVAYHITL